MFITYTKYKELGGTIESEAEFNRLEFKARSEINKATSDRIKDYNAEYDKTGMQYVEEVNFCMLELIENGAIALKEKANAQMYGGEISSISNDGYSINFKSGSNTNSDSGIISDEILNIILTYLPSNLTYAGNSI